MTTVILSVCFCSCTQKQSGVFGVDYELEPMPSVHAPLPENSVPMGDGDTFEEVKLY